jgi:nicotinate phosphoribosyltransferase
MLGLATEASDRGTAVKLAAAGRSGGVTTAIADRLRRRSKEPGRGDEPDRRRVIAERRQIGGQQDDGEAVAEPTEAACGKDQEIGESRIYRFGTRAYPAIILVETARFISNLARPIRVVWFGGTNELGLASSALLTDLYQLNMLEAYLADGERRTAVFEFFFRKLPKERGFLLAAGLEQVLDFLEGMRFTGEELDWLAATGRFTPRLLDYLAGFRFSGDVHAMAEGTVCFPHEPVIRITSPLPEAQLAETRLINLVHFETLIASKAARNILAAPGKTLIDFGFRRAHGGEAGLLAARASYIAGFTGTATVLAGKDFGIPLFGTMAHSYIQAHDDESEAFEKFARARPQGLTLLLDTYDTVEAAKKVVALAPKLRADGITIRSVRIDSGDLAELAKAVRAVLDAGGLPDVTIIASGGLDEYDLLSLAASGAPIDGYGIGTSMTTSSDAPALDCAYKLQEYAGKPRRKKSAGKATWPGRKQVWRRYDGDGRMAGDIISLETDRPEAEPLLSLVMKEGRRIGAKSSLADIRAHAATELGRLPEPLQQLGTDYSYKVEVSGKLEALAAETDKWLAGSKDGK